MPVPDGYIDVTRLFGPSGRQGIAGPDHPFYVMRNKIADVLAGELGFDQIKAHYLADKIMEAM